MNRRRRESLDDEQLADYIRNNTIDTVIGPDVVSGRTANGRRRASSTRQNVSGNDIGQFKDMSRQIVVRPPGPAISSIPMAKRAGEPTGLKRGRENESSLG
jgi:hypothetical protein